MSGAGELATSVFLPLLVQTFLRICNSRNMGFSRLQLEFHRLGWIFAPNKKAVLLSITLWNKIFVGFWANLMGI